MSAVEVIVALLMVVGLAGAVVPFLPGTPVILLGAIVHAAFVEGSPIGLGRLTILAVLAALGFVLEHAASAVGARRFGGGRAAVTGALVGAVVGIFFAPVGLLLGPLLGAVVFEFARTRRWRESLRTGVGAALGVIAGAVSHFVLALTMVALVAWWVWRG